MFGTDIELEVATTRHLALDMAKVRAPKPGTLQFRPVQNPDQTPSFVATHSAHAVNAEQLEQGTGKMDSAHAVINPKSKCPACRGRHRPHTCGRAGQPKPPADGEQEQEQEEEAEEEKHNEPVPSPAIREPQVGVDKDTFIPPSLKRLHQRLSKELELYFM